MNPKEATVKLRHDLVFNFASLVAPRLSKNLKQTWLGQTKDIPRPFTKFLKKQHQDNPNPLIAAEIGYGFGENAENLKKELNIKTLYCIDKYLGSEPYQDAHGKVYDWCNPGPEFYKRLEQLKTNGTKFVITDSHQAFQYLPRNLDFIYIDGNHAYENVLFDLHLSFQHVRLGGFIGGHDFGSRTFDVSEAVFKVAKETGLTPTIDTPDFWFRKEHLI